MAYVAEKFVPKKLHNSWHKRRISLFNNDRIDHLYLAPVTAVHIALWRLIKYINLIRIIQHVKLYVHLSLERLR